MKNSKKTKEKKRKGGKVKKVLLVLLVILLIAGGVFAYKVHMNGGGLAGMLATTLGHDRTTVEKLPKMYCLILGKSQNLTDTLILASYDPKTQEASMLSIPRDTFIGESESRATAWDKINAVYQTGAENVLEKVRKITGIDVKYYVMVDTEALKKLVDEIGGVTFDVPINMNYDDNKQGLHIHLEKGEQKLDGDKAEQVVRFRHNSNGTTYPSSYGTEDIGRMRTQRAFLTALAKQTLVPSNVTKIPGFIDIAKKYVETNLNVDDVKDYVPYAVNFNVDNLKTDKLPGKAVLTNGVWIYSVDEDETENVINKLFYNQPSEDDSEDGNTISNTESVEGAEKSDESESTETKEADNSNINIEILNGSGNSNNLSEVVSELKAAGYKVTKTAKTTKTSKTTIINRRDVSEDTKNDMYNILDTDSITMGQSSGTTDITIILGTDYII